MEAKEMEINISLLTTEIQNVSVVTSKDSGNLISNTSENLFQLSELHQESKVIVESVAGLTENEKYNEKTFEMVCEQQNLHPRDEVPIPMDIDVSKCQEFVPESFVRDVISYYEFLNLFSSVYNF